MLLVSKHKRVYIANFALAAGAIAIAAMALLGRASSVEAIAPCVPHTPSGEELGFVQQLQSWRNSAIPGSQSLTLSAPLNAAAMGYAQFLADNPGAGGHYADGTPGYAWATRAVNCGYPANLAAGGEGVAVSQGSSSSAFGASSALSTMTAQPGSGVNVPANVGLPVQCVGVGKATSQDGTRVAWVTLLFASNGTCPSSVSGGNPPQPAPSSTASSTATTTPTKTPSPTSSPTPTPPPVFHSWISQISRD